LASKVRVMPRASSRESVMPAADRPAMERFMSEYGLPLDAVVKVCRDPKGEWLSTAPRLQSAPQKDGPDSQAVVKSQTMGTV